MCVSESGQFQVVDIGSLEVASTMGSIDPSILTAPITCFDMCPTSQGIVFGDGIGMIHLFGMILRLFSQAHVRADLMSES